MHRGGAPRTWHTLAFRERPGFPFLCLIQPPGAAFVPIAKIWRVYESSLCSEASHSRRTRWPWEPDCCHWPTQNIQKLHRWGWGLMSVHVLYKCYNTCRTDSKILKYLIPSWHTSKSFLLLMWNDWVQWFWALRGSIQSQTTWDRMFSDTWISAIKLLLIWKCEELNIWIDFSRQRKEKKVKSFVFEGTSYEWTFLPQ